MHGPLLKVRTKRKKTISTAIAPGEVSKMPLMCSWSPPDMLSAVD
jgi:hypothetical protein